MMEADFKQALRLLHVYRAWECISALEPSAARDDPLFPIAGNPDGDRKMRVAIRELLEKYPYPDVMSKRR